MDQGKYIVFKGILFFSKTSLKWENDSGLTSCPQKTKTNAFREYNSIISFGERKSEQNKLCR
jgi:hypothetical protein